MNLLRSLVLAFSSFSKIPMPQVEWNEQNMRYLMCCFPAIGVAIGLCLGVWCCLAGAAGFGPFLFGAGIALMPLAVTGGFHLDGFCDVVDAQSSHADPARKRKILKDPHIGAFAAIGVACYLVAYAAFAIDFADAACAAIGAETLATMVVLVLLTCLHVLSRCASGLATVLFAQSGGQGMLAMFQQSAEKRPVAIALLVEFVAFAALACVVSPVAGVAIIVACLLCLAGINVFARTQFGGMSGDLAGFFLQVAELVMIVCLVVVIHTVGL